MSSRTTSTIRRALQSEKMLTDEILTQYYTTQPSLHNVHIAPSIEDTKRTTTKTMLTLDDSCKLSDEPPKSSTQHVTAPVGKIPY